MANPYAKWATTPEAKPSTNPYAHFAAPKAYTPPPPPPKSAPKPTPKNQTFSQRMRAWMGIPEGATNTQAWMHVADSVLRATPGLEFPMAMIHPRNAVEATVQNGVAFGYGPELNGLIYGAVYGKKYGEAVAKRGHEDLEKFHKSYPKTATGLGLAGNIAGSEAILAAAPEVLGAAGLGGAAALAGRAANWGKRLSRGTAAVGAGAGGVVGAYEGSHEGLIAAAEGLGEGTAAGAGIGYLAPRHLGSAALGGAMGALQGSGEAGPGHRWEGAKWGGLTGAAMGVATPVAFESAAGIGRAFDASTGYSLSRGMDKIYEEWNRRLGRPPQAHLTPPERAAARRLAAANERSRKPDTKATIDAAQKQREDIGVGPADKAYQVAGPNLQRLGATAATKSPEGRKVAQAEADRVRVSLPHSLRTQGDLVAPHTQNTVEQHAQMLADQRSEAAAVNYREPYAQPVVLDEISREVLNSKGMRTAISSAKGAIAEDIDNPEAATQLADIAKIEQYQADYDKWEAEQQAGTPKSATNVEGLTKEQQVLLSAQTTPERRDAVMEMIGKGSGAATEKPVPPEVSAGTIDQIRRAGAAHADTLTGTKLAPGTDPNRGSRLAKRVRALDDYLDGMEHLQEARGVHKAYSARMEVMKEGPKKLTSASPADFKAWMEKQATGADGKVNPALLDAIKQDMRVVLRERLTGKGDDLPGAAAMLREIETGANLQDNIRAILGPEETDRLIKASKQLHTDLENANEMQASGSRTSRDRESNPWVAELGHQSGPGKILNSFLTSAVRAGRTMTAEEGQAMIDLLHGDPHTLMDVIEAKPDGLLAEGVRLALARAAGGYMGGRQSDTGQSDPMPPVEKLEDMPMTEDGGIDGVVHDPTPSPYDPPTPEPQP